MKPTPTPEMIEAAMEKTPFLPNHINRAWMAEAISAALSVQPAEAVVGEPEGWTLVPIEPTPEMIDAGRLARMNIAGGYDGPSSWEAMLAAAPSAPDGLETIQTYYERQIEWSRETFGPALRTKGVLDHIRKELAEIELEPHDLSEWVDVVILAMDGFWRHGGNAADLLPALLAKQKKNMARTWPDWRTMSEDRAIEHDRSKDVASGGDHE